MEMEGQKTSHIIQQVYGSKKNFKNRFLNQIRKVGNYFASINWNYGHIKTTLIVLMIVIPTWTIMSVYYYNKFTANYYNVLASTSKMDTVLDRRRNIAVNVSKIVADYSIHEKQLFDTVVGSRKVFSNDKLQENLTALQQDMKKAPSADLVSKLFAIAEQYPDLKLSQNFLKFTDALVEIEKNLADVRAEHNAYVNAYMTSLSVFPGNFFNIFFGFKPHSYYKASDDAKNFWKINY
ncbi:MAG: LemA family protein [Oligoflexia bacterium]|nr:LemA family protein [Oligoflexia bacterium]MBF0365840.1 LemA family protein [Oligoflexia bacterium]